jgi:ABC-type branched-subunit amino acid transport system ATPase component
VAQVLNVSNLNAYYGESHVLRDVAITVKQGEVVVLLGPNGNGKSTLLKSICGLVDKAIGKITYQGKDISGPGTSGIPDIIKEWILFKSFFLAGLTGAIGFFYGFTRKP